MHTAICRDGISWWPESSPTPVDVSTLSTSGISNPLRLPGEAQWVGVWGDFVGLRIALSTNQSFLIPNGGVFPYPTMQDEDGADVDVDIFLTKDTGATGTANIARFHTMEAARAWAGLQPSFRTVGGSAFGPFPAASAMTDADPNPVTTRVGSMLEVFNGVSWNRVLESLATDGHAGVASGILPVSSYGMVFNDRTTLNDRQRQPDSFVNWFVVGNDTSLATASNVVASRTMTQNGFVLVATIYVTSATTYTGRATLYVTRGGTKYSIQSTSTNITQFQTTDLAGLRPFPVLSGDVITIETDTGTASATADLYLSGKQDRFAF